MNSIYLVFSIYFILLFKVYSSEDLFKENLIISNYKNSLVFHFSFQTTTNDLKTEDYHLFPKSIKDLVNEHGIEELHLSMSRGNWDTEKWGLQPIYVAPNSAELWAWLKSDFNNIDEKWKALSHSLSAQFCVSLSEMANGNQTSVPLWSYLPNGLHDSNLSAQQKVLLRRSIITSEPVCTENITPFIKLLPCKKWAGLPQLLLPKRLFSSKYMDFTVNIMKVCSNPSCKTISLKLHQTITVVLDRIILKSASPWSLYKLLQYKNNNFIKCPLATESRVLFHNIKPESHKLTPTVLLPENLLAFNLHNLTAKSINLDFKAKWSHENTIRSDLSSSPVSHFVTYSIGTGNVDGGVKSIIVNNAGHSVLAVYFDTLPWYFKLRFHTFIITVNDRPVALKQSKIKYIPSKRRRQMTQLELQLTIPPNSQMSIAYKFDKQLLNWNEYPPDANHEFSIPPKSLVFINSPNKSNIYNSVRSIIEYLCLDMNNKDTSKPQSEYPRKSLVRLYTSPLLVTMLCPDFSMPFNALCMACTVVAILAGGIHKYTTCSITVVATKAHQGILGRIKSWFWTVQVPVEVATTGEVVAQGDVKKNI